MENDASSSLDLSKVNFDNEVLQYLSVRKDELIESHEEYVMSHPEIREVLNDFLSSVLLHKPVSMNFCNSLITRTMFTSTPKNISIHLTQLLSEVSHSSSSDLLALERIPWSKKSWRSTREFSRRKSAIPLGQRKVLRSQEVTTR